MATNKNSSQNRVNNNGSSQSRGDISQAVGTAQPKRDAEAALGRSNAPAVRLQQQPSGGTMASGLRQYEPVNMPSGTRPDASNRITDPNDSYGWRADSNAGNGYYSEQQGDRLPPGQQPHDSYRPVTLPPREPTDGLFGAYYSGEAPAVSEGQWDPWAGASPEDHPPQTSAVTGIAPGAQQAQQAPQAPVIGANDMFAGGSSSFDETAGGQTIGGGAAEPIPGGFFASMLRGGR
jgi:hypothetical protein